MSLDKAKQLDENIKNLLHYYEIFLEDGKCRAVKSRKLLKDSAESVKKLMPPLFFIVMTDVTKIPAFAIRYLPGSKDNL